MSVHFIKLFQAMVLQLVALDLEPAAIPTDPVPLGTIVKISRGPGREVLTQ